MLPNQANTLADYFVNYLGKDLVHDIFKNNWNRKLSSRENINQ